VLYDALMGYSITVAPEPDSGTWLVAVRVGLSRTESNDLFVKGDTMVSWPEEGLRSENDHGLQRSGMFISEMAARPGGLTIHYEERTQAERTATIMKMQFAQAGITEETRVDDSTGPKQVDPLRDALAEYMTIRGVKAALLVSDQGLVISGVAHAGVDTATIAALAVESVQAVQRFGLQVQAGFLNSMRVEFDRFTFVLAPFAPDVLLVLVAVAGSFGPLSSDLTPSQQAATAAAVAHRPVAGRP